MIGGASIGRGEADSERNGSVGQWAPGGTPPIGPINEESRIRPGTREGDVMPDATGHNRIRYNVECPSIDPGDLDSPFFQSQEHTQ